MTRLPLGSPVQSTKKRLAVVFAMTTAYMLAEALGGVLTGSLALLADAGHMLTDAGALGLSLHAIRFAERPATPQKTFGYLRAEILAAFINATALLLITVYILFEAWRRFKSPPEVMSWPMLVIASLGLLINLIGMRFLASSAKGCLNVRAAYFEVLSDALGSVGVIAASLIMLWTEWYLADPIIGAAIGLFIVPRTWGLLKEAAHILLEGTPSRIDLLILERRMRGVPGVVDVDDLHSWTITSGRDALAAHIVIETQASSDGVLRSLQSLLEREFGIEHTTLQLESAEFSEGESRTI